MQLIGANAGAMAETDGKLPGISNYLIGNNKEKWHANIANYQRVRYRDVYPGIDLCYYGNQRNLEHDFIVAPGADAAKIRLRFAGVSSLGIDKQGGLVLRTEAGVLRLLSPVAYQQGESRHRHIVPTHYVIQKDRTIRLSIANYDRSRELVIGPILSYSSFLGGSDSDAGVSIAVDSAGNAYVAGETSSLDFPVTPGAFLTTNNGGSPSPNKPFVTELFVSKINAAGTALIYSTYLGGTGENECGPVAVDAAGNAYVTGYTKSLDFPTTPGAFQTTNVYRDYDGFVTKLNSSGTGLIYSTYLGGDDFAYAIAIDGAGSAYVTGLVQPGNHFPITSGAFQTSSSTGSPAFVMKLNPAGSGILYSTLLGGSVQQAGSAIAVDSSGDAYVTGYTISSDFPVTSGAFEPSFQGGEAGPSNPSSLLGGDAFVTKLNSSGTALVYSTYLGGSSDDSGAGIAVDGAGNAYVTGETYSADFPVTANTAQSSYAGAPTANGNSPTGIPGGDVFVTKLNADGSGLLYSTFLGGNSWDYSLALAVDAAGHAYLTGGTFSTNFPVTADAVQAVNPAANNGASAAFVTEINSTGTGLVYSTFLGGVDYNQGSSVALDSAGNTYVTGWTGADFPTTPGAFQTNNQGQDAFIAKLTEYVALVRPPINSDGSSVFNANRGVVPVKFNVTMNGANTCALPPATISLNRTAGGVAGSIDQSIYQQAADNGDAYRIAGCQYLYNLAASSLGAGTYQVYVNISGTPVGSAVFAVR